MVAVFELMKAGGIAIVVMAIILGIGGDILEGLQSGKTVADLSYNISQEGLGGLDELASWFETQAIVIAAVVILGLVALITRTGV